MKEKVSKEMIDNLYATIARLKTAEDCALLFQDLCTVTEILQMSQRMRAAELLLAGKTYAEVIAMTDISSATLSRVSACVRHGSGGYKKFLTSK